MSIAVDPGAGDQAAAGALTTAGHRRKMCTREGQRMKRSLACAVAVAAACLLAFAPGNARAEVQSVEHTVRAGDNLHLIAAYYYGNPREWKRIWKLNRATRGGPNRLTPGTVLRIEGAREDGLLGSYEEFRSRVRGK
jgi:nucleoid-associated protein YgaU